MEIGKTKRIIESEPVKDPVPDREPTKLPLPAPQPQPSPTPDKVAQIEVVWYGEPVLGKWWGL